MIGQRSLETDQKVCPTNTITTTTTTTTTTIVLVDVGQR